MNIENIGNFLRSARKAKKLTQGDVADHLGVSAQAVSKWERGENLPDVAFFPDISKILAIGIDEILNAGMISTDAQETEEKTTLENQINNALQNLMDNSLFENVLKQISKVADFEDLEIDLDFFVYLNGGQKMLLIQAILSMNNYHMALDEILPYSNTAQRNIIITHILENQDYNLLEQLSSYMGNDIKSTALIKLLNEERYDIIEDNMPAFTRKHRDIIVSFIGENTPDAEIIENFIPFFDNNQRERLKQNLTESLKIKEEQK